MSCYRRLYSTRSSQSVMFINLSPQPSPTLSLRSLRTVRGNNLPPAAVSVIASVTLFFILALVCVGLRLWSIRLRKKTLQVSDYAILFASVLAAGYLSVAWLVSERGGLGRPAAELMQSEQELTRKAFIVAWFIQGWANSFVRFSILAFFKQIFPGKRFRIAVIIVQVAVVAYLVAITIGFAAICQPFSRNFDTTPDQVKYCGNHYLQFLLSAIFNLALDLIIFALQMPMLWRLQMHTRSKISLIFIFGLGLFVCFATAWRIHQVIFVSRPSAQREFSASVVGDALWSGLEINLGIINACLPLIAPALQQIGKSILPKALDFSKWRSTKDSGSVARSFPTTDKRVSDAILNGNQKWACHQSPAGGVESINSQESNLWMDARSTEDVSMGCFRLSLRLGVSAWEGKDITETNLKISQLTQA